MTVRELRELLENFDDDSIVYMHVILSAEEDVLEVKDVGECVRGVGHNVHPIISSTMFYTS